MFQDLRQRTNGGVIDTDIAVVGAGAAGITIARELIGSRRDVLLIESGALDPEAETLALNDGKIVGEPYLPLDTTRLRYFGGTVRPVRAKLLTIPAVPEAYGKSARDFPNLGFAILDGKPALVDKEPTFVKAGKRIRGFGVTPVGQLGGRVFFWLAHETKHEPDPTVLPTDDDMIGAASLACERWLDRILERGEATA